MNPTGEPVFYRRGDSGLLEIDSTVPYLPNSGYAFPVTEGSWHGVDPIPPGAPPRDSLMLIWYVDGAWKKLGRRRGRRVVGFARNELRTGPANGNARTVCESVM